MARVASDVKQVLGATNSTFTDQLNAYGSKKFGKRWLGAVPSDQIPHSLGLQPGVCLINLDKHDEDGSHWIAAGCKNGEIHFWDSFSRSVHKLLPSLDRQADRMGEHVVDDSVGKRPVQGKKENNCGQRAMSWLESHFSCCLVHNQ
jgi:hypothetical protein